MLKLDPVTLAHKDKNNRDSQIYYLKHTMKQAAILRDIVKQSKSLNPLDSASYSACNYVKLIQVLLGYVRETFPNIHKPSEKIVVVMPLNKKKMVRVIEGVVQPVAPTTAKQSLPIERRTDTLIWRNKTDLEEQSLDDLFNSLKIYKTEVKSSSSASTSIQNIAFVSSNNTDNTNEPISAVASVSATSAKILVFALPNVDTLSNAQIDYDDYEEMDLKWKMTMLTVRARKGHFARECRSPKDTRRNGAAEPQRRNVPVDTSTSNALILQCDGVGSYDWSFQAEVEPTNYALMAFTSTSSSSSDNEVPSCSKACTKAYHTLQSYYDKLTDDFRKSQFDVISYKIGLEYVEDLEEQSLDDLFNSLKIYEAEVKSSSSASTSIQNITFVSSNNTDNTNEPISAVASVSAASAKILVFALPNVDTLSNAQIDYDDLEEMDLKWKITMLTVRARRFIQRKRRNLRANRPTLMGFDMLKVECYNFHRKRHFARECRSPKDTRRNGAAEPQRRNVPVDTSTSNALILQCDGVGSYDCQDIKLLKLEAQLRDNALVILRQKFKKAEQERDDLKLRLENFQTSSKNLSQLLASQTNDKTRLAYHTQVFTSFIFDCDEMFTSETDDSLLASPHYDRNPLGNGYHAVPPSYTGTFMPPKPDLVFMMHSMPLAPVIEDWVSDSEDDYETIDTSIPTANHKTTIPKPKSNGNCKYRKACFVFTAAILKTYVTRARKAKNIVTKPYSPPRRHINYSSYPKASTFPLKVTVAEAPMVNAVKGNWVRKPKYTILDHVSCNTSALMTLKGLITMMHLGDPRNMSYLFDFKELNGGYVAFGGNPNGGKISGKDATQVLLRVPRENNMYNVDLKNIVPLEDLTCLFAKATLHESNLWHRRLGYINYKTMNKLVKVNTASYVQNRVLVTKPQHKTPYELLLGRTPSIGFMRHFGCPVTILNTLDPLGKFDGKVDEGFLVGYSVSSKDFRVFSSRTRIIQETLHINFLENKTNVTGSGPTCSVQSKKHDDKTNREAKGKSPIESSIGYRNLSTEFEYFSDNNINDVNAADSPILNVGKISTNSTNTFSAAGPSNAAVNPTHGKSSCIDTSQYPDDPNMPELEDITYFDDEEDVGAEADFTNLETSITEERIDYEEVFAPVARIEAIRTIKEEVYVCQPLGFEDPDYHDKIYVDDIIFGSTNKDLCKAFEKLMKDKFQMSSMGELTFFLGLQMEKSASTTIYTKKPLLEDPDGEDVDVRTYRSMIGSLMYLTSSRPDIMFANASSMKYALTVKPNIYVSCIKQLWTSVSVKKVNDVPKLQALVDMKRVIITEATIRVALRLADVEGIDCLPNEEIFTELARMGYEKPSTKLTFYKAFFSPQWKFLIHTILQCMSAKRKSWNEFSSSMASAVICVSTGRKFNFSKYIFDSLVRNVDSSTKFCMVGKGCSGEETPLFEGMIVEQQVSEGAAEVNVEDVPTASVTDEGAASVNDDDVPAAVDEPSKPSPTLSVWGCDIHDAITPKGHFVLRISLGGIIELLDEDKDITLKDVAAVAKDVQDAEIEESSDVQGRKSESQAQIYQIDLEHVDKVLSMQDDEVEPAELQEVVELVTTTKLITKVVTAASAIITAAAPQLTTATAPTLTTVPSAARRRKGVVIRDPKETATPSTIIHSEAKSKDKGKGILDEVIDHVERKEKDDNDVKRYKALKRKPQMEAQARKDMMIYLTNKTKEQIEEEDSRALKRINESQEDKAAKKQKLDEEVEELRKHLQIVPNDDDDVYIEATPLVLKVPIVDYEIYTENNKPYYKIKRADGSH
nr:putative ribonuclease H-like domain-containing protein [Tanacetum cinerariifolium]